MAADREQEFHVVVNSEGQYSIWPLNSECPSGWFLEGTSGAKQVCLDHIAEIWTDMRPRSLREHMSNLQDS